MTNKVLAIFRDAFMNVYMHEAAIHTLLMQKEIINQEEFDAILPQITALVDQRVAALSEKFEATREAVEEFKRLLIQALARAFVHGGAGMPENEALQAAIGLMEKRYNGPSINDIIDERM